MYIKHLSSFVYNSDFIKKPKLNNEQKLKTYIHYYKKIGLRLFFALCHTNSTST